MPLGDVAHPAALGTGTRDGTRFLRDDGTWQEVEGGGGGGGVSELDAVTPYRVKAFITSLMGHLVVNASAMTINLNHALMDLHLTQYGIEAWQPGEKVFLSFRSVFGIDPGSRTDSQTGVYVLGSLADPSAVPLTRDPDFLEWKPGAVLMATYMLGQYRACHLYSALVKPADDTIHVPHEFRNFILGSGAVYLFPWESSGGDGVLPGGTAANTRYAVADQQWYPERSSILVKLSTNYDDPGISVLNITNDGTGSDSDEGPVGLFTMFGTATEVAPVYVRLLHVNYESNYETAFADWTNALPYFGRTADGYTHEDQTTIAAGVRVVDGSVYDSPDLQIRSCELPMVSGGLGAYSAGSSWQGAPVAIGNRAMALEGGIAIGTDAKTFQARGIAIGTNVRVLHEESAIFGGSSNAEIRTTNHGQYVQQTWNGLELASVGRIHRTLIGLPYGTPATNEELPRLYLQFGDLVFFKGRVVHSAGDDSDYSAGAGGAVFEVYGHASVADGGIDIINWKAKKVAASPTYGGTARILDITGDLDEAGRAYMVIHVRQEAEPSQILSWTVELEVYEEKNSDWSNKTMYLVERIEATPGPRVQASEALSAGQMVNLWNSSGARVRKADASSGRPADGYVLDSVASGEQVVVYLLGENPFVSGLSVGRLWVGEDGAVTGTAPTSGMSQEIGFAVSATRMTFQRGTPIIIA